VLERTSKIGEYRAASVGSCRQSCECHVPTFGVTPYRHRKILQRIVAVTVAIVVGVPLVYYASFIGPDLGTRFSIYTDGVIREDIGFIGGSVLGCAVSVFAAGFLAIAAGRVTKRLLSTVRRR
jgi:hypothetical protein